MTVSDYVIFVFYIFFQDLKLHLIKIQNLQGRDQHGKSPLTCVKQTRVNSSDELEIGDHVVFRRTLYDHHGIIVYKKGSDFEVVEPTKTSIFKDKAKLQHSKTTFNFRDEDVRVVKYTDRLSKKDTASLAMQIYKKSIEHPGSYKYNLFTNNCEHFATFCATGRMHSLQVADFGSRSLPSYIKDRLKKKFGISEENEQRKCFLCIPSNTIESKNGVKKGDIIGYLENNIWHHAVVNGILESTNTAVTCSVAHCNSCGPNPDKKITNENIVIAFKTLFYKLDFESSQFDIHEPGAVVSNAIEGRHMAESLTDACSQFPSLCKLKR